MPAFVTQLDVASSEKRHLFRSCLRSEKQMVGYCVAGVADFATFDHLDLAYNAREMVDRHI
jgi:hypothetical protein